MIDTYPQAYLHVTPKARKLHHCYECRGVIEVGETYHQHSGVWDGPARFRICTDCERLRTEIDATIDRADERMSFGELTEYVFESDNIEWQQRYCEYRVRRQSPLQQWMIDRMKGEEP